MSNRKERPILFSTPMVKAIISLIKTMTRRTKGLEAINKNPNDWAFNWFDYKVGYCFNQKSTLTPDRIADKTFNQVVIKCPYGLVGDLLWVRETWCRSLDEDGDYLYRATEPDADDGDGGSPWKPSIHMPKAAARIWLKITDIKVERLQDISEDNVKREGAGGNVRQMSLYGANSEQRSFESLWKSINGTHSWNQNPWVWVVSFEKVNY